MACQTRSSAARVSASGRQQASLRSVISLMLKPRFTREPQQVVAASYGKRQVSRAACVNWSAAAVCSSDHETAADAEIGLGQQLRAVGVRKRRIASRWDAREATRDGERAGRLARRTGSYASTRQSRSDFAARICSMRPGTASTSTASGVSPSRPSRTALSVPCPLPVSASEP